MNLTKTTALEEYEKLQLEEEKKAIIIAFFTMRFILAIALWLCEIKI